uniref:diphthine methyl ester synthase n=1 Tax=Arcella intermedia TaxID=1963864 RepID=A0A6B2LDR0_9EUKA
MALYLIGLGLGDESDITVKGLNAIKNCDYIYLESYTSVLGVQKQRLEELYGKVVLEADREKVESEVDEMIDLAKSHKVAFLVVGDPFGATTHSDLVLRAKEKNVQVEVIHNSSILNAVGVTGLQLYTFGQTVSIVFWTETWKPTSFYHKVKQNRDIGLHTLCLLDIKVKEQSELNLLRGKKIYEPPRFMTINTCIAQMLEAEDVHKEKVYSKETPCFGVARIGQKDQLIVSGTMEELLNVDFGGPLHSFIICGQMHPMELEFYKLYNCKK